MSTSSVNVRLLAILCALGALTSCKPDTSSVLTDELVGDQIAAALDKYKVQRGSYPDTLWALEPDYVFPIVLPKYGQKRWD